MPDTNTSSVLTNSTFISKISAQNAILSDIAELLANGAGGGSAVDSQNVIDLINYVFPRIRVTGTVGTTITATMNERSVSDEIGESGILDLKIPDLGTWSVSNGTTTATVEITAPMQLKTITL